MDGKGKVKELLGLISSHQTSVCVGIAEEIVSAKAVADYLGIILVEKFLSHVVVRARDCQTVILEEDGVMTCSNCQELKEKLFQKNIDIGDDEDTKPCSQKMEEEVVDVKLEPEVQVKSNEDVDESEFGYARSKHSIFDGDEVQTKNDNHLKLKIKVGKTSKINCPEFGCRRMFCKYKTLVKHCKVKHLYDEAELPVKLENVKAEFESKKKSSSRMVNDPSAPNKCPDCEKCFWTHKSLVKHCVKVHKKTKEECPKPNYEQYLEKKKAVSNLPDKYGCQYCPKMFKFSSSVIAHTKRYHTETKMVPCEHCGKEVKQSNMEMHFKNNHATPRFTCNQCGKSFYFKALMVSHINVMHEGLKNHICDLCGAKFGIRKSLERHVRCQHEDHRPYICEYCQKAFHTSQKLQKHISGHLKDKIYVCTVCDARFYYKDNVRMHMKKSHPELDPKTECRVIDNPESGSGQMIHSMETGRRMRLSNNSKGSSGFREPDPAAAAYPGTEHKPYYSPSPATSEQSFSNTREYSDNSYDNNIEMVKSPADDRNIVPDHLGLQGGEQPAQQYLHQPRPDLSNYLLGLRYGYSQYQQHQ